MSTQVVPIKENAPLWSPEEEKHIREYYAKDANDNEWKHFLFIARERGLDPRLNQFYFVKYGQGERAKASFITSIDGYRLIAQRTGRLEAIERGVRFDENNELYGWAKVWVKGSDKPFYEEAPYSEYSSSKNTLWQTMQQTMIKKCAEACALRMAFPQDLSGLYTSEEMDQASNREEAKKAISTDSQPKPAIQSKALMNKIMDLKDGYGISDQELKEIIGFDTFKGMSLEELELSHQLVAQYVAEREFQAR